MDEQQEPLTDIEQSRADTGFRYYVVQPDELYTGLVAAVDADRAILTNKAQHSPDYHLLLSLAEATDGQWTTYSHRLLEIHR
jgi:hypothetical protein